MTTEREEREIYSLFKLSLYLKGLDGLVEIAGAILLVLISPASITKLIITLTHGELLEQPNDLIANYLVTAAERLSVSTETFIALYLVGHGIVKIILVVALLKDKLWAYPSALVVFGGFLAYELYRFTHTHAPELLLLMFFESFVIFMIWREYRITLSHRKIS